MRTVKEVSRLTGVSVRTLQYYDEIGLFKPTKLTESGYRLYDDEALKELQQILFFKELDFSLKAIQRIMENPEFDRVDAYHQQKKLLKNKRDRLNKLIGLLEKLEQGEDYMSFKEFDMSEYFDMLEHFRESHPEIIEEGWGALKDFDEWVSRFKEKEVILAETLVKNFGSIEKATEAMKNNLLQMPDMQKKVEILKKDGLFERNKEVSTLLLSDITRDYTSDEVQDLVAESVDMMESLYEGMDVGIDFWKRFTDDYLHNDVMIKSIDDRFGEGAARYFGLAHQYYLKKTGRME